MKQAQSKFKKKRNPNKLKQKILRGRKQIWRKKENSRVLKICNDKQKLYVPCLKTLSKAQIIKNLIT
jgi:hypothetical protein